ncbi:DUF2280 domain-containing protein [Acinetobacter sp. ANC 5659]|uniref:DUF2280 domain-containing protein n=1 Tax=Acinetobacter higginsii TaxID=70347 RepID=UPI0002CE62F8|nr:DUF2280 domain-containing protein [Acinetobacter higginsii]ENX60715.1 hypothetical protein F885_01823 [Acinetobacter higginsii]MCH7318682.1 DUF2280 domain-containing protein [Acinetobacter higginsii]
MARLNKRVKLYIVRSLAMFDTPTETAKAVQEEFGITVSKQQCEAYDPTKKTGQDLSEDLKTEFYRVRKEINKNLDSIPIANIFYRLQRLQKLIDHPQYKENPILIPNLLQQAAKEIGGLYTNTTKTQLTGADGQPLNPEHVTHVVATPEQIRQAMDELESKY